MGYRTVNTLTRAVYGLHLIYGSPVWGRLRKERRCTINQWSLVARRCLFRMGPRSGRRAHSVNRLRWSCFVCVDIWVLWRPVFFSVTVLVDSLHWSHRCLRRICQSIDGVVPLGSPLRGCFQVVTISCRQCLNHKIVVCLVPSAVP